VRSTNKKAGHAGPPMLLEAKEEVEIWIWLPKTVQSVISL